MRVEQRTCNMLIPVKRKKLSISDSVIALKRRPTTLLYSSWQTVRVKMATRRSVSCLPEPGEKSRHSNRSLLKAPPKGDTTLAAFFFSPKSPPESAATFANDTLLGSKAVFGACSGDAGINRFECGMSTSSQPPLPSPVRFKFRA